MDLGTKLYTLFRGRHVGTDGHGNRYYQERRGAKGRRKRRWVVYKGGAREASLVPPEWHGWLHHTVDVTPKEKPPVHRPWQKQHLPNLTGTRAAYRPSGHDYEGGKRARGTGDYEPWTPA